MNNPESTPDETTSPEVACGVVRPVPELTSQEILRGAREVTISHNGEVYRLRVTRNGKLILQK